MKARRARDGLLVLAAVQLGCDARAGSDYEGESLLSIEGNVVINDRSAPSELEPAIAFRDSTQTLHIVDVEVRGRFPASFRLDVLDLPPAEAFYEASQFVGGEASGRFALAYIAAVSPDHPDRIPLATKFYRNECESPAVSPRRIDASMFDPEHPGVATEPGYACFRETEACTYEQVCYRQVERCDHEFRSCRVIELTGDAELLRTSSAEHFAGLSSNYLVVYLEQATPARSGLARLFGGGESMAAGYHLLKVRDYDREELAAYQACWQRAEALSFERFNAAHGTQYIPPERPAASEAEERAFADLLLAALSELNCSVAHYSIEPVERLQRRKISIVVGESKAPPYLWD